MSRARRRGERLTALLAAVLRDPRRAVWYCKQGVVYLERQGLRATLRKAQQVVKRA
jgi:hypothetical protein